MTVVRTIGSGQQHADVNAWVAWVVANETAAGLLLDNVVGAVVTGAITVTATQTISGWAPSPTNFTTTLQAGTAAIGGFGGDQSFRASVSQAGTNALYYNASNGAALFSSTGLGTKGLLDIEVNLFTTYGMQYRNINGYSSAIWSGTGVSGNTSNCIIDSCIANSAPSNTSHAVLSVLGDLTAKNSVFVDESGAGAATVCILGDFSGNIYSCLCIVPTGGNTNAGIVSGYGTYQIIDTAIIGYAIDINVHTVAAGTTNNATSAATFNQDGTSGQTSVVASSEFINATTDFRLKSTSAKLKNNGSSSTVPVIDVVGTSRPQGTAYCIGPWEFKLASITTGEIVVA